jgi:hypothetical protein
MAESDEQFQFKIPNHHAKPPTEQKVGHIGNVEFERLDRANLKSVPVLVQALDNQWLPRSLLAPTFHAGQITASIDKELNKLARSEYIRALINGQQVILNRAYLYNSSVVTRDYAKKKSPMRKVFKTFLEEETIIPYLLGEKTPVDVPASGAGTQVSYGVSQEFQNWLELCQEVRPRCLRLSWDDRENWELTRKNLSERFNAFATGAAVRDLDAYMRDLGLDTSAKSELRRQLVNMGHFSLDLASQGKLVTRNDLYKAFITAGENPAERQYDHTRPFAAELKQLLDLAYNCNLPDALGGYLITPVDSLPRTALQEWQQPTKQHPEITGEGIVQLLKRTAFALVQESLNIASMDVLSLQDVSEIRRMDEWTLYMAQLQALLNNPLQFADGGAAHVYESYARLAEKITGLVAKRERKKHILTKWSPSVVLVFNIAGATLSFMLTPAGPLFQLAGLVGAAVAGSTAPVVGKMIIRDISEKHAQQDLSTSVDFMRYRMSDARMQWHEIEREMRSIPGFQEIAAPFEKEEIVDPTLSYQEIEY